MQCPQDQTVLQMTERQGVEIDYCPTCRGVWLDRGELDKILDRAAADSPPPPPVAERQHQYPQYPRSPDGPAERQDQRDDDRRGGKRRRKESFLGDLFDF